MSARKIFSIDFKKVPQLSRKTAAVGLISFFLKKLTLLETKQCLQATIYT